MLPLIDEAPTVRDPPRDDLQCGSEIKKSRKEVLVRGWKDEAPKCLTTAFSISESDERLMGNG